MPGKLTPIAAMLLACGAAAGAQELPPASGAPLAIDFARDPVLGLGRGEAPYGQFREFVAAAVARNPATAESAATEDEAEAAMRQAREQTLPQVDLTLSSYRVITREFSNDPQNIIERSRAAQRTDALASVQQTIFDFGAGEHRVRAAAARLRAAGADLEASADRIALNAVAAWYEVFGYRALVELTEAFALGLQELRAAVQLRIREGVSAEGDLAQVDSYIAQAAARIARFRRQLAQAEARFEALTGAPVPASLGRAPVPPLSIASSDQAEDAAGNTAAVRSAQATADAAARDARAARAERFPLVTAGVDAGRYGVFETDRDYDIRGRVTVRQRLFGGVEPRAEQFNARARAADARALRIRVEAERDAAIAWADVRALEAQLAALEAAYSASRRSRDVLVARFRALRGSLLDVTQAESAFFESATAYIQALTELDAARYVLLSRTGQLLDRLGIAPDSLGTAG